MVGLKIVGPVAAAVRAQAARVVRWLADAARGLDKLDDRSAVTHITRPW